MRKIQKHLQKREELKQYIKSKINQVVKQLNRTQENPVNREQTKNANSR